jgi:hypothetical protein
MMEGDGLRGERLRSWYGRWLPVTFLAAALANVALTPFLPGVSLPLRVYSDPSLTYLVHQEGASLDRRYGFYMELGDAAGGGTLVIPHDSVISAGIAEGLANLTVEERSYNPARLPAKLLPSGPWLGLFETSDGDLRYWILPGAGPVWWLAITDQGLIVVPEELAPVPGEER